MLTKHISSLTSKYFSTINNFALWNDPNKDQKQSYLKKLQTNSRIAYKKYPYLPHQDPKSSQYIHSQLDQYHDQIQVKSYNQVIDNFKNDLKLQRQIWDAINKLDRPYKKGIPGIDTNIDTNGPSKVQLQDLGFKRTDPYNDFIYTFANEDRFIANTPFHQVFNLKHIQQFQQQKKNRPVTKHFNPKGYKYDVQIKQSQKFQYVADRLGHPQFVGTPIQWLLRLQNDIYHPQYLDQPFVKLPSPKPHKSLNFQQGDILYQNTKILQWIKFWQMTAVTAGAFGTIFVPYNMAFKTNLITDAADQLIFQQYHLVTPGTIDIMRLSVPIVTGSVLYGVYALVNFTNHVTSQYIVKMSYSKDKELLFVKRVDMHGFLEQQVYQMAHLQILPPSQRTGVSALSSQDQDGLWRITCMNTQKTMLVYNNPKNWNNDLREQFFKKILGLWDKSYYGYTRQQEAQNNKKWREQTQATFNQQALPKN